MTARVDSPYLAGNFAPVHEELTVADLPVTGELPPELCGRFLRNGPNPVDAPDPATYHWFTGSGMVHGLRLRDGRAEWYRNRWVRSAEVATALGEAAPPNPFPPSVPAFAANTNVIGHAGRTFAIVEAGSPPIELTDDLETIGTTDLDGTLEHPFSAHPKRDPVTGELHVAAYFWGWGNRIRYLVVDRDARVRHQVDVEVPGGPMVHDIALTETYALLFDLPCTFDLDAAMGGASLPYRWNPDYGARVGLLPRDGAATDVRWVEVPLCYVFHPLNAYDLDDGRVVVDVAKHPRMFASDVLGPNEGPPSLVRWTLDPVAGLASEDLLDERGQEFPRHDERLLGRKHRFGYCATFGDGTEHGPLLKHDFDAGTTEVHDYGPGRVTLEAVFVPRSGAAAEDDGWVMSYVYDATTDSSDVVILHAQDFGGAEVAAVHLPQRVPFGFHGNWVPDDLT